LYTHIHPIFILSLYAYKFQHIVADPVPALLSILGPLAVLQTAFVAVSLPPTGETPKFEKRKPGEKRKFTPGKLATGINGKIVVRLWFAQKPRATWTGDTGANLSDSPPSFRFCSPRLLRRHSSQRPSSSSARP
jgi:hypothetical protein